MKYYLPRLYPNDPIAKKESIAYYTYTVLEVIIRKYGHTLVREHEVDLDTIVLASITTTDSVPELKRLRQMYPNNIIMAGGHYSTNFPVMLVWADLVNVGQGFDVFQQDSLEGIKALKCIAYKGKDEIIYPSDFIDWPIVPIANDSGKHYYYWGGVGCKNKCRYCFTSWTNRHQNNKQERVQKAVKTVQARGGSITITSNEYSYDAGASVRDMMLRDYIKTPMKPGKPSLIRLGIECVTEEMRRKTGKFFTDEEYAIALNKAAEEKKELNLFFITGLEPLDLVREFVLRNKDFRTSPKIFHKFTNIVYPQFTPMFRDRFDLKLEYYSTPAFRDSCIRKNGETRRNRYLTVANPQKGLYETAMGCVTTEQEYITARKIKTAKTPVEAYEILMRSKLLENDFSPLIKFNLSKNNLKDEI